MADNSQFVLRWEIDKTSVQFAAGKVESVFSEGGFKWIAGAERDPDAHSNADLTLRCDVDHGRFWKCDANVKAVVMKKDGTRREKEERFLFDAYNDSWCPSAFTCWLDAEIFNIDGKAILQFYVHILSSEGADPLANPAARFATADKRSNVILKIGEEKLHVCNEYLAVQSPFFESLFFGKFAENGKEEVEIKDVVYEEFVDLLNVIYLVSGNLTERNALHILKLADRFEMKYVIEISEVYLMQSKRIDVVKKLIAADKYRVADLKEHCFKSFTSVAELHKKLKSSPEVDNLSDEMKVAIFDRIVKLKLK